MVVGQGLKSVDIRLDTVSERYTVPLVYPRKLMVKATVADTSQLRWWLLGFGPLMEVVEPDFLRDEFRMWVMELAEIYQRPKTKRENE